MNLDFLVFFYFLFILILFIFQIILNASYQYDSKDLNDIIKNWKKSPIIGFSLSYEGENYDKNDFFEFDDEKKIYIKRMPKKFNFPYLMSRVNKLLEKKKCGTDEKYENPIYFEKYEECPINHISIDEDCIDENKCLMISNMLYLNYFNNDENEALIIEIDSINTKKGYQSYIRGNEFPNDFEYILSIKEYMKLCNNLSISLICFFIALWIIGIIILYQPSLAHHNIPEDLTMMIFELFIVFIIPIIICSISKIYMIKKGNKLLIDLSLESSKMKGSIYNLEWANLVFLVLFEIISFILFFSDIGLSKFNRTFLFLVVFLVLISLILLPVFFSGIGLMNNPFNDDSFYNNLKKNYEMSPITEIEISKISTINKPKESSYFNPKVPYRLGVIKRNDKKTIYLTQWKNKSFYITRMNKKYTYPKITRIKTKDNKLCGKDSKGNNLFFPKSEACPINYIEFTNSDKPSKEYNFITKRIDQNTYMHYTNEFIEGEILVHLRISNNDKTIGNDDDYNELCHYLYEDDNCKSDKEYLINNDFQLFGYEQIDEDYSYSIKSDDIIEDKIIYLYKRTYIGTNSGIKIGNEIFYIKSFIVINQSITMICYILIVIIIFCNFADLRNIIINIFCISLNLIPIILNIITIKKYRKVKKELDNIDIFFQKFSNNPLFIKLDLGVIIIFFILLIFLIIYFLYYYCKNECENEFDECSLSCQDNCMDCKDNFIYLKKYNEISICLLFFLFLIIFFLLFLLIDQRLYNEGYIQTIRENWKKAPIMDITLGYENEKIGSFKNFKNKKSKDIYNWQGISFNFIRKSNKDIYTNIIKNKGSNMKRCGKDSQGNTLYFYESDDCPINYVKIASKNPPDEINGLKYKVLQLNQENYLYFTNEYENGKILIDFKVSNFNGPCLNKNKNNEICSFFLKKCDLEEKDYICNAYKSINAYDKISNYSFTDFVNHNELNIKEDYDEQSQIYLYSETYIGFKEINNKVKKYSPQIFTISKLSNNINVFILLISILLFLGIILLYFHDNELFIIIESLFLAILSILIIILTLISFIKYYVISNNVFKQFENEISDYYNKTRWQIILTIIMFILFICFFIYIIKIILKIIEFNIIIEYIKKAFEIMFQRKIIIYCTIIFNIIIIILLIITLILKEYNDTVLKIFKENWNKSPIKSISIEHGEIWELGKFKDSTINNWKSGILKLNRMENKKYTDFLINRFEDKKSIKICGKDNSGNELFFLEYEDCPINYINITNDLNDYTPPNNLNNISYLQIGDYYIFYSNENTEGKILIDFEVSDLIVPSVNPKLNNQICKYVHKKCDLSSKMLNYEITGNEFSLFEKVDTISLSNLLENNNINVINYSNTNFYLYTQTYIGCAHYFSDYSLFFNNQKFSTIKNSFLLSFTILFLLIPIALLDLFEIKKSFKIIIVIYVIFNLMMVVNFIFSCISIYKYNKLIKKLLKYCENSIGESFKSRKWYCKINICFIIFYLIDLGIGIYFYFPLKEKFSTESYKKQLEDLSKEEERLNNEISEGNMKNEENKKKIDEEFDKFESQIISNHLKLNIINKNISELNSIINNLELKLVEKQNELNNLDERINLNYENKKKQLIQELNNLKNINEKLENEKKSLQLINKDFNKDYTDILALKNNTI